MSPETAVPPRGGHPCLLRRGCPLLPRSLPDELCPPAPCRSPSSGLFLLGPKHHRTPPLFGPRLPFPALPAPRPSPETTVLPQARRTPVVPRGNAAPSPSFLVPPDDGAAALPQGSPPRTAHVTHAPEAYPSRTPATVQPPESFAPLRRPSPLWPPMEGLGLLALRVPPAPPCSFAVHAHQRSQARQQSFSRRVTEGRGSFAPPAPLHSQLRRNHCTNLAHLLPPHLTPPLPDLGPFPSPASRWPPPERLSVTIESAISDGEVEVSVTVE